MKITGSGRARLQSCRDRVRPKRALAPEGFKAGPSEAKASCRLRFFGTTEVVPSRTRKAYFHRRHGGHGDFTEASGCSVHVRVLRVSVVSTPSQNMSGTKSNQGAHPLKSLGTVLR